MHSTPPKQAQNETETQYQALQLIAVLALQTTQYAHQYSHH